MHLTQVVTPYAGSTQTVTYDNNGNRLTQTSGGNQVQSFQYDAHDKLTSGIGESETYDANGNLKTETVSGQTTSYTYDDEDRLTQIVTPSGTSTVTYNGLGLRTGKTDSTGVYAYVCDGTSPASPALADAPFQAVPSQPSLFLDRLPRISVYSF